MALLTSWRDGGGAVEFKPVDARPAEVMVEEGGLRQINDLNAVGQLVAEVLAGNPPQVAEYRGGKKGAGQWLFGQVMRASGGRANPGLIQRELDRQLDG